MISWSVMDPSRLYSLWQRLARLPGGRRLFGLALGLAAPYTGTIRPLIEELRPGYARVRMRDRRRVRNHLRSVHAIALANLAEVSSGLALLCGLPAGSRAILLGIRTEYVKKARGTLTAECGCAPLSAAEDGEQELELESVVRDAGGAVVVRATAPPASRTCLLYTSPSPRD